VFVGSVGNGKTRLAKGIFKTASVHASEAMEHWGKGPQSTFCRWSELLDARGEVFEAACEDDLTVIDDIGAEVDKFKNGQNIEKLCALLEHRANKFTVITTNISPHLWSQKWDERVESRLNHNSIVMELSGPDLRKTL
jgi:DNA replication protein DnaC